MRMCGLAAWIGNILSALCWTATAKTVHKVSCIGEARAFPKDPSPTPSPLNKNRENNIIMKIRKLDSKQDVFLTALVFHLIEQSQNFQGAGLLHLRKSNTSKSGAVVRALASHQCGRAQILALTPNVS